ncbi:MAG: hypothetical protein Q9160_009138 [Pyrenula sp. 1 TL-2023]
MELESPQPVRVENVVAKRLMHYVLTLEEMEIFLKQRFREHDDYNFEVRSKNDRYYFFAPEELMATKGFSDYAPLDPFKGWENYPLNLARYDPITTSGPALQKRLQIVSPNLFGNNVNVKVFDLIDDQDTFYQFRYAEENNRSLSIPWSQRQTGVYHQHSADVDLWILLNPTNESVVERQLKCLADLPHSTAIKKIAEDPYQLHILILESYLRNWRWYLQWLDEKFEKRNNAAYVFDLKQDNPTVVSFEAVQALRDLHDDVSTLSAHFNGDLKIIDVLKRCEKGRRQGHTLGIYANLLHGYNESLAVLQKRVQNVIDLTAYALDTKSQDEAAALNQHILRLTNESLDVNATVKTITILSLLYLPGSFVGTIFGTNFFWYNNKDNHIEVGTDFWIYVVTWIGLTIATMLTYLYLRWPHHWKISGQGLPRWTARRNNRVQTARL